MANVSNQNLSNAVQRLNSYPENEEALNHLLTQVQESGVLLHFMLSTSLENRSSLISQVRPIHVPFIWERIPEQKNLFFAIFFSYHISKNNQFSTEIINCLNWFSEHASEHGCSIAQQQIFKLVHTTFRYAHHILKGTDSNSELDDSEIEECMISALKLHICALICFKKPNSETGSASFIENNLQWIENPDATDECINILRMFAKHPLEAPTIVESDVIEHTSSMVVMLYNYLLNQDNISDENRRLLSESAQALNLNIQQESVSIDR